MAEVTEKPQEPSSDSEIHTRSSQQQTPSVKGKRKRKAPFQLQDYESEKIRKIVMKVKSTLWQSVGKCKEGKKSMILVFYYQQKKRKNENQPEEDEEVLESSSSSSSSTALCLPGN